MSPARGVMSRLVAYLRNAMLPVNTALEKNTVLTARMVANANRSRQQIENLSAVEFSAFSQWGEDGIIDWLIERLPGIPQTFVEFGVENYREANTRLLLQLRNWRGLIIDGSDENMADVRRQNVCWRHDLKTLAAFITKENINELIAEHNIAGEIGLLSIDIDGNDYWVWEAIEAVSPVLVVCEFNAVLGNARKISVPYDKDFVRSVAHYSNVYFGASLPALEFLGGKKGYDLIGTGSNGCNAFFVRKDRSKGIFDAVQEIRSYPSRFREGRARDGQLTLAAVEDRLTPILDMPVVDVETGELTAIRELGSLYTGDWAISCG